MSYNVHKATLARYSSYFRRLFIPYGEGRLTIDVTRQFSKMDLELLLSIMYKPGR